MSHEESVTMGILILCMFLFAIGFIWHVLKINKFKLYVYEKDNQYTKRFNDLEITIKSSFKEILETIKK